MADRDGPRRVTLPTLQILAVFMSDPARERYGRELADLTGLGSGTVLQCLYRMEGWGWLKSRWEDQEAASRDGRPPRCYYRLTGLGRREASALLADRFRGTLRFGPHQALSAA